jgi:hypothetical protein
MKRFLQISFAISILLLRFSSDNWLPADQFAFALREGKYPAR